MSNYILKDFLLKLVSFSPKLKPNTNLNKQMSNGYTGTNDDKSKVKP
jgi:hypothetical protein